MSSLTIKIPIVDLSRVLQNMGEKLSEEETEVIIEQILDMKYFSIFLNRNFCWKLTLMVMEISTMKNL